MRLKNSTAIGLAIMLAGGVSLAQAQQTQDEQQLQQAANGDCEVVWQDLDQEIAQDPEMRAHFDRAVLRDLRVMRDAAIRLEEYGHIQACNNVGQAIHEIMQDPEQYAEAEPELADDPAAVEDPDVAEDPEVTEDPDFAQEPAVAEEREAAAPLEELGHIRFDELIGADVRSQDDNSIGQVDDIVIGADAEQGYLIVGFGGFLGLGEEYTAVPLDMATISSDHDVVYLPLTEEELEQAQRFEHDDTAWLEDEAWQDQQRDVFADN